ncbi:MAG TPA: LptF/LptG family permease [Coleofasciculaceae cyanobacterium]|jgi:lipopolysaccharide export system permease protein
MSTLAPQTPAIKLVDRYIFKQLFDYFLMGVVVLTLVFFFSDTLLNFIRDIQKYGIPFATLMTMVGLQLPKSVAWVLPASGFLAVLMVFNNLNNQFEIITMRMNGISLWRLAAPALVLGLFCSGATYLLNDYIVPWCNDRTVQMTRQLMQSGTLPPNGNSFMYKTYNDKHNLVQMIYVNHYEGRTLGDSTIIDLSKPQVMQVLQSRSGTWDPDGGWNLKNVNMYVVAKNAENSSAGHLGTLQVAGLLNKDAETEESRLDELRRQKQRISCSSEAMNFSELSQCIDRRVALGRPVKRSNYLDLWKKLTWPLGALVLILNAVPLALSPPRKGSNRGFLFAIIIMAVYYQLFAVFQNIAKVNFFDFLSLGMPMSAHMAFMAWLPFVVMALIGAWLMRRKSYML